MTKLIKDGDFATPYGGGTYTRYFLGQSFGPWKVAKGSIDLIGGTWQSPTPGGGSVDLDGTNPGAISQKLKLTAGNYRLTFDLSGNPDGSPATKTVEVTVGTADQIFTYTIGGNSHANMNYSPESLNFTTTGVTTVSFSSLDSSSSAYGPVIANIALTHVDEIPNGETLVFGSPVSTNETVSFLGSGTLELDDAPAFRGSVLGFGAGDTIDLGDINFAPLRARGVTAPDLEVSFTDNSTNTGGALKVSDGANDARIALIGQFAANFAESPAPGYAGFVLADDGKGHTAVTYIATPPSS
jgi:choice-of-anchor C domain-containing protein